MQDAGNEFTCLLKIFHPCSCQERGTHWVPTPKTDSEGKRASGKEILSHLEEEGRERVMWNTMDVTKIYKRYIVKCHSATHHDMELPHAKRAQRKQDKDQASQKPNPEEQTLASHSPIITKWFLSFLRPYSKFVLVAIKRMSGVTSGIQGLSRPVLRSHRHLYCKEESLEREQRRTD